LTGMSHPSISVIIANYNGAEYLRDCLSSLGAQTFRDFEVIVVDNGSTDDSLALIKREFSWAKVIPLDSNTGFAAGNNVGIAASSAQFIATLNNDTIVGDEWLAALHEAALSDENVGMVASKIFLGKEGKELDSAGMLVYPDGMSRQRGRGATDEGQFDTGEEVLFPSACAALYRREMLDAIGLFDEDFFSYCEDSDLGLRARLAGWKAVLAPRAVVRHLYSATGGKYSEFKAFYVERNRFWVLLKVFPLSWMLTFPFYTLWRYIIQSYGLFSGRGSVARLAEKGGKLPLLRVVFRAYRAALSGLPRMLKKRKMIWKTKRVSTGKYKALMKSHRITAVELMLRD
jgi:GT2 family glycosyltransferase